MAESSPPGQSGNPLWADGEDGSPVDPAIESGAGPGRWRRRTMWARERSAPLRAYVRTESGSAVVLVAGIAAALTWANIDIASYQKVWGTDFSIALGRYEIRESIQTWINSGLMTFFFLVVGLETRREFDLGDLRERRRFVLPLVAGVAGMLIPIGIYLLINLGRSSVHGWGVAMSTDTALALGVLAVLGRDIPDRMRVFVLTVFVVDDLAALVVIAVAYSGQIKVMALVVAAAAFALLLLAVRFRLQQPVVFVGLGIVMWGALRTGGVDPIVAGLVIGLAAPAYTPARGDLQTATGLVRRFREQPTPELARSARVGLSSALSPNERLQTFYHPWTSYVIVPLFALANAGIVINGAFLKHAYTAPVPWGCSPATWPVSPSRW
jgi:Na+/H+ antiporter NhaA